GFLISSLKQKSTVGSMIKLSLLHFSICSPPYLTTFPFHRKAASVFYSCFLRFSRTDLSNDFSDISDGFRLFQAGSPLRTARNIWPVFRCLILSGSYRK